MAARHTSARVRIAINEYRRRYSTREEIIANLKADFLRACDRMNAGELDPLTTSQAGEQTASFAIGATAEEIVDALSQTLDHFTGVSTQCGWTQARII